MKKLKLIIITILAIFVACIVVFLNFFKTNFGYSPKLLINTINIAHKQSKNLPKNINFLILGIDPRDDWLEKSLDTDTIILASLDTYTYKVNLLSLPRDLWYYPVNSRINKIYQSSLSQDKPLTATKNVFSEIVGKQIDYLLILDTNFLTNFITILGSVEVDLPYSIVDTLYPDPLHIKDPVNFPNPYTTITFQKGTNLINSSNVDYFVRSRKGSEIDDGGTDIGRSNRQQLLIMAIFDKLKNKNIYTNQNTLKNLYQLWGNTTKTISDQDLLSVGLKLNKNLFNLSVNSHSLPIGLNKHDLNGVIYHPDIFAKNAWVFLPTKDDLNIFRQFIDSNLF